MLHYNGQLTNKPFKLANWPVNHWSIQSRQVSTLIIFTESKILLIQLLSVMEQWIAHGVHLEMATWAGIFSYLNLNTQRNTYSYLLSYIGTLLESGKASLVCLTKSLDSLSILHDCSRFVARDITMWAFPSRVRSSRMCCRHARRATGANLHIMPVFSSAY